MQTTTVRASRAITPLTVAAGAAVGCVALAAWNPGDHGVTVCPTKSVLGIDCPFCGGLRAVAQLTRGHPLVAADHNVVLVLLAPVVVGWWLAWWIAERRGRPAPTLEVTRTAWLVIGIAGLAFTVVRNLKVGGLPHWLAASTS